MGMNKKTIKDVDLKGKKVFCRVDYNVPFDENMNITNDTRIQATKETVKYMLEQGAAVILACHIGRPTEEREDKFSTKHIVKRVSEVMGVDVKWAPDCVGPEAEKAAADLKPGEILLLENLRYHKEEKKNDPGFAKQLASLADIAVNDAFGVSHRAHAANVGVAQYLESVAGFLMEKEIKFIGQTLEAPKRPFVAIIGGAKVSDKIGVISNMIDKVDTIIIGGGMAHTFDAAQGLPIGNSICEKDKFEEALGQLKKAKEKGVKVVLSWHDFAKTPKKDVLVQKMMKMQKEECDLIKIAVMPNSREDVLSLMGASVEMAERKAVRPFITMAMGTLGRVTRAACALTGSCVSFGTAGTMSAPGQISAGMLRQMLRVLCID